MILQSMSKRKEEALRSFVARTLKRSRDLFINQHGAKVEVCLPPASCLVGLREGLMAPSGQKRAVRTSFAATCGAGTSGVLCGQCFGPNALSPRPTPLPQTMGEYSRAGHLFLTIPHPCLFLPPLTKQSGVPPRRV